MQVWANAINPLLLRAVWATWPERTWRGWHHYSGRDSEKYGTKSEHDLTPAVTKAMSQILNTVAMMLPSLSVNVFPDLEFHGAGMHMIMPGGYLSKHLDSSVMESTGWKREYSVVLGVNPEWHSDWGGEFVLGSDIVWPEFNQLIVFKTTETSWHEVKQVTGPVPRCTLALFLWSQEKPDDPTRTQARFA